MQYVVMTGDFLKLNDRDLYRPIDSALTAIGVVCVDKMKGYIEPHNYRKDLSDSIMWKTSSDKSSAEGNEIDAPPAHCVDIGSANDHALYVERGTGPHLENTDSGEFVAEIIAWARTKGFDEHIAWAIIKKIRNEGTMHLPGGILNGIHYAEAVKNQGRQIAKPIMEAQIRTFWAKQRQV